MPAFTFQAKIPGGKVVRGEVSAANETEARVKIRAQNLVPVSVTAKGMKKALSASAFSSVKVSSKELQVFTRQFATLVNSGIPIVQGLEILEDGTKNAGLKAALKKIKDDISTGKRLAEAMSTHSTIFNKLYVNLVKAGEEGGILDTILNRLAIYIEKAEKIKNKVKGAMWYPIGVLIISVIVISIIITFVIPKFEELFKSTGKELPELTQMVIDLSHYVINNWYVIIGAAFAIFWAAKAFYQSVDGRLTCDEFFIRLPIVGSVIQKSEIARFSRTLSTLLSSGVALLDALDIAAGSVGNAVVEKTIRESKTVISEGKSMTLPFAKNPYMPDMVVQMIGVGEQTGALDTMLGKVADFYEDEVDYAVTAATTLIEPLMMVFLGGIVAVLVIAMYLPIFGLADSV
ncbi:MAG: type II secretion system F family protein [Bdellovibrionales bacterium]|nr:type II secretion system F family protein [Bdellovibrionales bacterium]